MPRSRQGSGVLGGHCHSLRKLAADCVYRRDTFLRGRANRVVLNSGVPSHQPVHLGSLSLVWSISAHSTEATASEELERLHQGEVTAKVGLMDRTDLMTASTSSFDATGMVNLATRAMGRRPRGDEKGGASIDEVDISLLCGKGHASIEPCITNIESLKTNHWI